MLFRAMKVLLVSVMMVALLAAPALAEGSGGPFVELPGSLVSPELEAGIGTGGPFLFVGDD